MAKTKITSKTTTKTKTTTIGDKVESWLKTLVDSNISHVLKESSCPRNAGVLFLCPSSSRVLLSLRSPKSSAPNTWAMFGGGVEDGESIIEGVKREVLEECQFKGPYLLLPSYVFNDPDRDFVFHSFIGIVKEEFQPIINWEHTDSKWFDIDDLPSPLHPGLEDYLEHKKSQIDGIIRDCCAIKEQNALGAANISGTGVANAWASKKDMQKTYDFLWSGDNGNPKKPKTKSRK